MISTLRATASVALLLFAPMAATAAPGRACQPQAIRDLQRLSPEGYAVYQSMKDKKPFLHFLVCDNIQLGLATAVHESVHMLTDEKDAYPLISGRAIKRVHQVSRFYPPREIAARFDQGDTYVQTYLHRGQASSADDFKYLLDELNAYSHDLNSAVKLMSLHNKGESVDHRAGLAALMSFVTAYVDRAKAHRASTWQGLQQPEVKALVAALWTQAETVLTGSLNARGLGGERYVKFLCDRANGKALGELLGRRPASAAMCSPHGVASSTAG